MIAALYVEHGGVYYARPGVECWGLLDRDARDYAGPWPVVAHPPCQLWGPFAVVNFKRWGGEHNRPGNDGGCFKSALAAVREYGGVLEHPAFTKAWPAHGLIAPTGVGWKRVNQAEWVGEIWQSAYGHKARKRTWLFYKAVLPEFKPYEAKWDRKEGSHQIGFHDQRGKERNKPTLSKKESSRTPKEFADYLICLAHRAGYGR